MNATRPVRKTRLGRSRSSTTDPAPRMSTFKARVCSLGHPPNAVLPKVMLASRLLHAGDRVDLQLQMRGIDSDPVVDFNNKLATRASWQKWQRKLNER